MRARRNLVRQAIGFQQPERIPIWFVNCDQIEGDVMAYSLALDAEGGDGELPNEWGYRLVSLGDGTMGHPTEPVLPDWEAAEGFTSPALSEERRMADVPEFLTRCEDRYRLASLVLSGFTVYTLLRGFENAMVDFLIEPERFASLMDLIVQFECKQAEMAGRFGFDGIIFYDDWGTQNGLMIAPDLWRRLFRPRYEHQFARAHRAGLDVWYHCCGNFAEIAGDFHEIGVDVLNISQPNVVDIPQVGARYRGQQCFMAPISYQTVSIQGTVEDIHAEAQRLYELLGTAAGGFIGYVEEYGCMGMSAANYRACAEAFRRLRPEDLAQR